MRKWQPIDQGMLLKATTDIGNTPQPQAMQQKKIMALCVRSKSCHVMLPGCGKTPVFMAATAL